MRVGKKRAELVKGRTCKQALAQAVDISAKHIHRESKQEKYDEHLRDQINEVHKTHPAYVHTSEYWSESK